ncbi:protein of unknown function DUF441 [Desulfofarcimen acetoxidans DSM 771]|jgi:uncharacterized membrane protein (DUF441 family)|uniref:UPF0756 membrane protein Dtox_2360 n=1 Tax=Desulfofarcimen acetoxidans (strain ATCC 49208 / DSM 771 / KCTC 5769 / VKM B-1644 / 5575) TaxID=485916 RepID=C8W0B6_DESAS|nr:DUF441 domain-containing protein [Desulfofarcimen acetoxidans]ACV63171.1 protein of unknown function DUF441 [Desulfofarcimen acetoxidans DSM 771]
MSGLAMLIALLVIGVFFRSNLIAAAALILLILKLVNLQFIFPYLEKRGLEIGLLFLIISILVPLASGKIDSKDIIYTLTSLPGLMAILGGALATHLNGEGLKLLQVDPAVIFGLVFGSIIGIVLFNGQPVGPLMAAGITALFLEVIYLIK